MSKKSVIILSSVVAICGLGVVSSYFIDWPVDVNDASGDIAKATRFSREQASEKLLIPTAILLIIVIIVVMYPAFIGMR